MDLQLNQYKFQLNISDVENNQKIEKNSKTKNCFFMEIYKSDKPVAKLITKKIDTNYQYYERKVI